VERRPQAAAAPGEGWRRTIQTLINVTLLAFLLAVALAIVRLRNLFAVAMLSGIFSLLSAALFVLLDAVDVAFTEAAVGTGISTVLMLGTLALTGREEGQPRRRPLLAMAVVLATTALLLYGTADMPAYGDPAAPIHTHVAPRYIEKSGVETGVPNIVTAVLASYRGYDTLGETTVIFTAGVGVLLLLGRSRRKKA
jgi:multicomponent Na+:H+ antiporter subunit B